MSILAFLCSTNTYAANLEISKFIEIGATATDNLGLDNPNTANEDDLAFNIKPSVELKYTGNKYGLLALGEVEYIQFHAAEEDIVDPRLFSRITGTLVEGLVYLDTNLTIAKRARDNSFIRPSDDGETAGTLSNTLFTQRSFGQFADLYAGYTYSIFSDDLKEDPTLREHEVNLSLKKNPNNGGLLWGLGAEFTRDEALFNEFEDSKVFASLGHKVAPNILGELTYGIENRELIGIADSDFQATTEIEDEAFWHVDFTWSPSELTDLTVGYGDRFFGSGPSLSLSHRISNSLFTASYTRDISRAGVGLNGIQTLTDNTTSEFLDPSAIELDNLSIITPLDEPVVDNRFRLAYKLTGRVSDFVADAIFSNQESLDGIDLQQTLIARLIFDRSLSETLSYRLQYDYQDSEVEEFSNFNFVENRFGVKLIYSFDGNKRQL